MLRRLREEEDGTATLEFVLWMPLLTLILMLVTEATLLMQQQTRFYDGVRDASRQVAVGQGSEAEAETFLRDRFSAFANLEASVTSAGNYVTARVSAPFNDVVHLDTPFFGNATLSAEVMMWVESNAQ